MSDDNIADSWIWLPDFKRRMWDARRIIETRGWRPTIPAFAEASGLSDKRIRSRLNYHPRLKAELGVVPSLKTGRYAAAERRS